MRILYPIGTFYPAQSGGPSNSVYWLAKALVRQGVKVTVVSTDTDQPVTTIRDRWIESEAGRVRYVSTSRHNLPWQHLRQSISELSSADIVHLTSLFYPLSLAMAIVALRQKKVVVWSPRGELAPVALANRSRLKQLVLGWIRMQALRITFHSTSPEETRQIRQQLGTETHVIELPNFMELPPLINSLMPERTQPYLLFLGRLHPIKALDRLLEAAALSRVFRQGKWQVRFVGADTIGYGDTLRQQANALGLANRIRVEPPVSGIAKQHLLANAYALVLPSHSENFGNVVVEALAQGTPVIASTGTPWAILQQEQAGFWVANDKSTLATTLDECLSLPTNMYAYYRQQAALLARRQYDISTNSHRWLSAYSALLVTNSTPPFVCAA